MSVNTLSQIQPEVGQSPELLDRARQIIDHTDVGLTALAMLRTHVAGNMVGPAKGGQDLYNGRRERAVADNVAGMAAVLGGDPDRWGEMHAGLRRQALLAQMGSGDRLPIEMPDTDIEQLAAAAQTIVEIATRYNWQIQMRDIE